MAWSLDGSTATWPATGVPCASADASNSSSGLSVTTVSSLGPDDRRLDHGPSSSLTYAYALFIQLSTKTRPVLTEGRKSLLTPGATGVSNHQNLFFTALRRGVAPHPHWIYGPRTPQCGNSGERVKCFLTLSEIAPPPGQHYGKWLACVAGTPQWYTRNWSVAEYESFS